MLRRLISYWKPAAGPTVGGVLLLAASSLLEILQPWPMKWLVDVVLGGAPAPAWLAQYWPNFGRETATASLAAICVAIVVLAVLHRAAATASQFLLIRAGGRLVQELRCRACDHLHRLSLRYHDQAKVGDSLYRIAYDTQAAQSLLNGALAPAAAGILLLLGVLIVMFRIDPWLTVVAIAVAPLFWILIQAFGKTIERQSAQYHRQESSLISFIQESLSSIRAVQAFTQEQETNRHFSRAAGMSLATNQKLVLWQLAFSACVGLAMACGTAAVVWFGTRRVLAGQLSLGDVLVFLAYLGMLYSPMKAFSEGASVAQTARTQLQRVFEILDTHPEVVSPPDAIVPRSVTGRIEFDEVDFEYNPGQPILRDVNLSVEPGQIVAIVGRTGAGKSTLASLLLRFYDPLGGSIRLDGRDLRDLSLEWLRGQMSIVLQDPILFSTSIAENIAYARSGATRDEVIAAARRAEADEFIQRLPDGYDTVLGERGVNLSGGQRQRLSLARAILKDAPVLILDEPTSALDAHTEKSLMASIEELVHGRTTFLIAHRLSTVRIADVIVVMDHGRIVEQGTHEELLARDSAYGRLFRSQCGSPAEVAEAAALD
jgi:ATP-binding cassette, subfamily B, bacterial